MLDAWPHEQRAAAIAHLTDGLWAGERCMYVGPASSLDAFGRALSHVGVDVEGARRRGALVLADAARFQPPGELEPRAMLEGVQELVDATRADGFTALRLACDMRWALEGDVDLDRLVEYERIAHGIIYPTPWLSALCFYPRGQFDQRTLRGTLAAHPILVRGHQPLDNGAYSQPHDARPFDALLQETVGPACGPEGLHVLVVDSHVVSAAATADVLASWGDRATVAHDAESAFEAAALDPPDVALIDLASLDLDAGALASRLRGANARLLVATTTRRDWLERERTRASGFDHGLLKPFAPTRLACLLDEARSAPQNERSSSTGEAGT